MSQITRCPACTTMFRVVPDQLRVAEGWARCGQCNEIFDALAQLQVQLPEPVPLLDPVLHQPVAVLQVPLVRSSATMEPAGPTEPIEPILTEELGSGIADQIEPSFLRQPKPRARPAYPWIPLVWGLASLLLTLSLLAQIVRHEGDRIATMAPGLKPWIAKACRWLDCTVMPRRQIEEIGIDGSTFYKKDGDTYQLKLTLKNKALIELATPSIELTLTDSQDRPVARRIFAPGEAGLQPSTLAPQSESTGFLTFNVKALASAESIAGYRVLAFYP